MAFLAGPEQSGLTEHVWNKKGRTTTLGGAAPNSARASAHWIKVNKHKGKIVFMGSIGDDDIGYDYT